MPKLVPRTTRALSEKFLGNTESLEICRLKSVLLNAHDLFGQPFFLPSERGGLEELLSNGGCINAWPSQRKVMRPYSK